MLWIKEKRKGETSYTRSMYIQLLHLRLQSLHNIERLHLSFYI
jgi:hypothetical protein